MSIKNYLRPNYLIIPLFFLLAVFIYKFYYKDLQYISLKLKLRNVTENLTKSCKDFAGVIVEDEDGVAVIINTKDDTVGREILTKKTWEPHLRNVLKQIAKPNYKVVVLGAHIGYHALLISKLIGGGGKIFIFEPNPVSLRFLKTNISFNDIKNAYVYPFAAFDRKASLDFKAIFNGNTGGSHLVLEGGSPIDGELIKVDAIDLDSILSEPIDLLQMDIEGAEEYAVQGMKNLIEKSPNLIVVQEYSPNWMKNQDEYLKFWRSKGYSIAKITDSGLYEMTDKELKSLTSQIDIVMSKNLKDLVKNFRPL